MANKSRVIAHMDMDAFFAAVEQRDNPSFMGKPVIIGADPKEGKGRGVVSTCSYEARVFGVHSAMPISKAYQLCPKGIFVRGNHKKYSEISHQIFDILESFTPDIQPVSIDEAFMDLTTTFHLFGTPLETGRKIKERIKKEVDLNASIGIAPNKMIAKIASDYCKPDGLIEIKEDKILDFLWPLPIKRLWGVGRKTQSSLEVMGIHTIGDIARTSRQVFVERFGEHGVHLYTLANGIDNRAVEVDDETKSVSNEHTFDQDTQDKEAIYQTLSYLSEKVSRRLRKKDLKGKTISLKVRTTGFKTFTRAHTVGDRINFFDDIYAQVKKLFDEFYQSHMSIRLVGVRVSNFNDPYVNDSLFEDQKEVRKEGLHKAVDKIKDRFGERSITRGW